MKIHIICLYKYLLSMTREIIRRLRCFLCMSPTLIWSLALYGSLSAATAPSRTARFCPKLPKPFKMSFDIYTFCMLSYQMLYNSVFFLAGESDAVFLGFLGLYFGLQIKQKCQLLYSNTFVYALHFYYSIL